MIMNQAHIDSDTGAETGNTAVWSKSGSETSFTSVYIIPRNHKIFWFDMTLCGLSLALIQRHENDL